MSPRSTRSPACLFWHCQTAKSWLIVRQSSIIWTNGSAQTVLSTPPAGPERRKVLKYIAVELGIMDKLVAVLYERQFRPKEKWHRPWIDACDTQIRDGFKWVDSEINDTWLVGDQMTQADISLAVFKDFATRLRPNFFANLNCDAIDILTDSLRIQTHFKTPNRSRRR